MSNTQVKEVKYTDIDKAIVGALANGEELTLAQLAEVTGKDIKAGHVVSAMKKGLIEAAGDVEVMRTSKSKVKAYTYVNNSLNARKEFTDKATEALNYASQMGEAFTIAELNEAFNVKVAPATITSLVKNGNIEVAGEKEVVRPSKTTVKAYRALVTSI